MMRGMITTRGSGDRSRGCGDRKNLINDLRVRNITYDPIRRNGILQIFQAIGTRFQISRKVGIRVERTPSWWYRKGGS